MKPVRLMLGLAASILAGAIACASGESGPDARKVSPAVLAKGQSLYKATCAQCHGDAGKGDGPASKIFKPPPRDHTNSAYMDTITDEDMGKTIQMGGALKGKPAMPSHPQLKGEELKALIAYVRSLSRPVN